MNCPGSISMERGLPDDSNDYSDEGTAAHLLGSTCLESGTNPEDYAGRKIFVGCHPESSWDGAIFDGSSDPCFEVRRVYVVDDEMVEAISRYVNVVRQHVGADGILMAEERVPISSYTGEENAAGTSDAVILHPDELEIHDLKYGMGVRVYAERNKQLMLYALGVREALELAAGPFKRIRIVIHMPRLDHLDEWDCTSEELDAFGEEVKAAAVKALGYYDMSLDMNADPTGVLNPAKHTCQWCKAKATCPALAKYVADASAMDFEAVEASPSVPGGPALLAQKMAAIPLIEDWCKAVRAKVESELFAGVAIPGWKIVQGKKGNQSWTDEEKADALLKKMRLPVEERCNLKLKSPTQIQKMLKATPKRLARLCKAALITQRDGLPSVAPEHDKRPAWVPPDTSEDFTAEPETIEETA